MRPLRVLFSSPAAEKFLHECAAFFFEDARSHFNAMIQKISIADLEATPDRARAFVRRAVNQAPDPCLDQSSGAHRARFDRRVNINAGEPVITELPGGLAQGDDFSVGSGIAVGAGAISGDRNEFIAADNTSADRHLTATPGLLSRGQRLPHPVHIKLSFRGSIH
jgi:hypothetical protein